MCALLSGSAQREVPPPDAARGANCSTNPNDYQVLGLNELGAHLDDRGRIEAKAVVADQSEQQRITVNFAGRVAVDGVRLSVDSAGGVLFASSDAIVRTGASSWDNRRVYTFGDEALTVVCAPSPSE
jgi:hypothetical protein